MVAFALLETLYLSSTIFNKVNIHLLESASCANTQ